MPVPDVVAAGGPDSPLEAPFVLAVKLPGEALATRLFKDERYGAGVERLTADAAESLAAVHAMPVESTPLAPHDLVAHYRQVLDFLGEQRPPLELAHRWLEANRPAARPIAVVHGDFRLGNLLVDETGLRAVLDWELAHLGDPLEDVAWPAIRPWRFDKVRPAGAFCDRTSWIAAYEAATGVPIERAALSWWEVAVTFKWAVICLVQAYRHLSGLSRSVELAAIGRRVCESEWDLLVLMAGAGAFPAELLAGTRDSAGIATATTGDGAGAGAGAAIGDEEPGLQGTTTAVVLTDAVRELLEARLLDATRRRVSATRSASRSARCAPWSASWSSARRWNGPTSSGVPRSATGATRRLPERSEPATSTAAPTSSPPSRRTSAPVWPSPIPTGSSARRTSVASRREGVGT